MGDIRFIAWAGYDFKGCPPAPTASGGIGSGTIELEYGWQLVAIPVEYGYWDSTAHQPVHDGATIARIKNYVMDQIEDIYATAASGIVEVANTYTGDNQFFWNYVVGNTPDGSQHNFQLVYNDGSNQEISGFWIKIIGPAAPYTIEWGE
jgi:hypothetical protein